MTQLGVRWKTVRCAACSAMTGAAWMPVEPVPTNYHRFVEAVHSGVNGDPSFRYAADMQKVLDLGFVSDQERKEIVVG